VVARSGKRRSALDLPKKKSRKKNHLSNPSQSARYSHHCYIGKEEGEKGECFPFLAVESLGEGLEGPHIIIPRRKKGKKVRADPMEREIRRKKKRKEEYLKYLMPGKPHLHLIITTLGSGGMRLCLHPPEKRPEPLETGKETRRGGDSFFPY